jgi:plastocyanin
MTVTAPSFNLSPYEIDCFGGGSFTGPVPDSGFGELPDKLKSEPGYAAMDDEDAKAFWSGVEHTFYIFAGDKNKNSPICYLTFDNQCYDRIINFKLMETDRDTGVFTGSVHIVESAPVDEPVDYEDNKIEYGCYDYDDDAEITVTVREQGNASGVKKSLIPSASADLINCYVYQPDPIPNTFSIDIPAGTSVPGCEETHSCYDPSEKTLHIGAIVEWTNVDTAAHTVTSGTPAGNVGKIFDSGLILAGGSYSFTFDEVKGQIDYFCMVHPWMTGTVIIE